MSRLLANEKIKLNRFFVDEEYLNAQWHFFEYMQAVEEDSKVPSTWRLINRMKINSACLSICLNIGIDPPDIFRPNPCARKECWIDPTSMASKEKVMESIGFALLAQFKKWQGRIPYKVCLDATTDELRKASLGLGQKKVSKSDRLLLYFNGHGVPNPTKSGEIWVFGKGFTHYMPISAYDIRLWFGDPAFYILDCSGAGVMIPFLTEAQPRRPLPAQATQEEKEEGVQQPSEFSENQLSSHPRVNQTYFTNIVLAACKADETLPMNPLYPADVFTACLTTPYIMAVKWFIAQNPGSMVGIGVDFSVTIPGEEKDRKSPLGQLQWLFTTITDTIAWSSLPSNVFQKLFREDLLVSALFSPQSWPPIPDTSTHVLWHTWDMAVEDVITQYWMGLKAATPATTVAATSATATTTTPTPPAATATATTSSTATATTTTAATATTTTTAPPPPPSSTKSTIPLTAARTFFIEQLNAFEIWLDFAKGGKNMEIPMYLTVMLQVLLSMTHQVRALLLLRRFMKLGPEAINYALIVGIFPYMLKLFSCPFFGVKQIIVHLWASILNFDPTGRMELVKDRHQLFFVHFLASSEPAPAQRCAAACALAQICDGYRLGQESCLQMGLHGLCCRILTQPEDDTYAATPTLRKWILLCLAKLCEGFAWAKFLFLTEMGHTKLYPLLVDADAGVRAAAVLALGELLGTSANNVPGSSAANALSALTNQQFMELQQVELQLAIQILECCSDGCANVRREAVIVQSKFMSILPHFACLKLAVKTVFIHDSSRIPQANTTANATANAKGRVRSQPQPPWMLHPNTLHQAVSAIRKLLQHQAGVGPADGSGLDNNVGTGDESYFLRSYMNETHIDLSNGFDRGCNMATASVTMAPAYLRIWLALKEIQSKDPHFMVERAAALCTRRIELAALEEKLTEDRYARLQRENQYLRQRGRSEGEGNMGGGALETKSNTSSNGSYDERHPPAAAAAPGRSASQQQLRGSYESNSPQSEGLGYGMLSQPLADVSHYRGGNVPSWGGGSPLGASSSSPTTARRPAATTAAATAAYGSLATGSSWGDFNGLEEEGSLGMSPGVAYDAYDNYDTDLLKSHLYEWNKKLLLKPCGDTDEDDEDDPLSEVGKKVESCRRKRDIALSTLHKYSKIFRTSNSLDFEFEGMEDSLSNGRQQVNDMLRQDGISFPSKRSSDELLHPLPPSVTKFEQKSMISNVEDPTVAEIWQLRNNTSSTVMKTILVDSASGVRYGRRYVTYSQSAHLSSAKIAAMTWINELSDSSLLMLGCTDGSVRVWRDTLNFSDVNDHNNGSVNDRVSSYLTRGGSRPRVPSPCSEATLCTAFTALPDMFQIRPSSAAHGSGIVLSWQQATGSLLVGGNSSTLRLWDLGREQCVRALQTGVNTCVTSLLTEAYSPGTDSMDSSRNRRHSSAEDVTAPSTSFGMSSSSSSSFRNSSSNGIGSSNGTVAPGSLSASAMSPDTPALPPSWTFAGFGDGTVAVFDSRSHGPHSGRVALSKEFDSWVMSSHVVPGSGGREIVSASVSGVVKFWDIRKMRSYHTLDTQKGPVLAFVVHPCAPVLAMGLQDQRVKITTMSGQEVGQIRYHENFLGQRIGPISKIAFHPLSLSLAIATTDKIVSLFVTSE